MFGELSGKEKEEVELHIVACDSCKDEVVEVQKIFFTLKRSGKRIEEEFFREEERVKGGLFSKQSIIVELVANPLKYANKLVLKPAFSYAMALLFFISLIINIPVWLHFTALSNNYVSLQSQFRELDGKYKTDGTELQKLQANYASLENKFSTLDNDNKKLLEDKNELKNLGINYALTQDKFNQLKSDFQGLAKQKADLLELASNYENMFGDFEKSNYKIAKLDLIPQTLGNEADKAIYNQGSLLVAELHLPEAFSYECKILQVVDNKWEEVKTVALIKVKEGFILHFTTNDLAPGRYIIDIY